MSAGACGGGTTVCTLPPRQRVHACAPCWHHPVTIQIYEFNDDYFTTTTAGQQNRRAMQLSAGRDLPGVAQLPQCCDQHATS